MTLTQPRTTRTYNRWSKVYDGIFGPMVGRCLHHAIAEMRLKSGDLVLDLGVGTGISFEHFPPAVRVVGMDISSGMLLRAQRKARRLNLPHVHLVEADAQLPPFAPHTFDHILLTHVVSVVADPAALMRHAAQIVKPGGTIVLVNHFKSPSRAVAAVQKAVNPVCKKLGWRSDLSLQSITASAPLRIVRHYKLNPLDFWRIVVLAPTDRAQPGTLTPPHTRLTAAAS